MKYKTGFVLVLLSVFTLLINGCGSSGSSTTSNGSGSEIAASSVAGASSSTEGTIALLNMGPTIKKSLFASVKDQFSLLQNAWGTTCSSIAAGASCSGSTLTYDLGTSGNGCTTGAVSWTGNMIFTWTTGSCVNSPKNSAANAVFTRTTDTTGLTRTAGSNSIVTTTQDSSGYSTPKTGGMTITCGSSGCSSGRSIVINGVHYTGSSVSLPKWDHTVSTDDPVVMTGTGGTRVISSMTVRVQHNLAQFMSVTTVASPLTHTAGCCFPTGGTISTSYSGGPYDGKSETLVFSSTCGQATLTPSGGTASSITLTHCL